MTRILHHHKQRRACSCGFRRKTGQHCAHTIATSRTGTEMRGTDNVCATATSGGGRGARALFSYVYPINSCSLSSSLLSSLLFQVPWQRQSSPGCSHSRVVAESTHSRRGEQGAAAAEQQQQQQATVEAAVPVHGINSTEWTCLASSRGRISESVQCSALHEKDLCR